jgi:hypothetical protein
VDSRGSAAGGLEDSIEEGHRQLRHIGYVAEDLYRTFYSDAAANIELWLESAAGPPVSPVGT